VLAENASFDRYTIVAELGSGAFGKVYAARDGEGGQLVALKELSHLHPSALSRFKLEFRAVQGLDHPNLVRLDALLEYENRWLIAMELVEGEDLLDYVRASDGESGFDEGRLRAAFQQIAEGLTALHAHGVLHRDLKPENVRVTKEGRVVVLDFGLVTAIVSDTRATGEECAGTAAYMAPEQARSGHLAPSADWYAFGVCLYQALTGALPFEADTAFGVLLAKQNRAPEPPSRRTGDVLPRDLEALCMALLSLAPEDRPSADEVRRVLASDSESPALLTANEAELEQSEHFEGRKAELAVIESVHERARSRGLRTLLVEGESGIGKSALVSEWLRQLRAREPDALVLKSQCYENERSAFKAFDAGMDALGHRLNRWRGEHGLAIPHDAALLPRVFPTLADVPTLKNPLHVAPADPHAALRCALIAFAKLLDTLAGQSSVVLVIDDLQWADPESFRLLRTLSESAHAPHVLVLATIRPERELDPLVAGELAQLRARAEVERLPLTGLSRESCAKLAHDLLEGVPSGWLERITSESKGHPLFVAVLSRYAATHRPSMSEQLSLEAALGERLVALDTNSRRMLDTLAVAGVPCSITLLSLTMRLDAEAVQRRAAELVRAKLVRRLPQRHLACFHDRIRASALAALDGAQKATLHGALANALSQDEEHDPALLASHLEGAARHAEALRAHHQAADRALDGFAFAKAEHHYGRAAALGVAGGAPSELITTLRIQRGHALARAGRSAPAAQQYLDACELASERQRVELRVWAAQHLLQSAQVAAGLAAAREVLSELGVPLPESQVAALSRLIWDRICLGVSGLKLHASSQGVSVDERAKLDAMSNLSLPVAWVETLPGAALTTRHLRLSLSVGERAHAARALAQEAMFITMQEPEAEDRAKKLFERARSLYDAERDPTLEAFLLIHEGSAANFRFDLATARTCFVRGEALLRARCPEEAWLLTNARTFLPAVWWQRGEFGAELPTIERWLEEASARDDLFAGASLETLGLGVLRFLLRDEPARVQQRVSEIIAPWPRDPFALVHLGALSVFYLDAMYRGGDAAWKGLEEERPRLTRAFLLKARYGKGLLAVFRAGAALAMCSTAPSSLAPKYLHVAREVCATLARSNAPLARFNGPLLRAQLAAIDGDLSRARTLTQAAAHEAALTGYHLLDTPLAYLDGRLEGGDSGREKRERALAQAVAQGWKNPRRFVAMVCPVIDYLETRR